MLMILPPGSPCFISVFDVITVFVLVMLFVLSGLRDCATRANKNIAWLQEYTFNGNAASLAEHEVFIALMHSCVAEQQSIKRVIYFFQSCSTATGFCLREFAANELMLGAP